MHSGAERPAPLPMNDTHLKDSLSEALLKPGREEVWKIPRPEGVQIQIRSHRNLHGLDRLAAGFGRIGSGGAHDGDSLGSLPGDSGPMRVRPEAGR